MRNIILFDMDGTLTPPRERLEEEVCQSLKSILDAGHKVGIITGSGMDYLLEQCWDSLKEAGIEKQIGYYPCNGNKFYKWSKKESRLEEMYSIDMRKTIGRKNFEQLICWINKVQQQAIEILSELEIPFTGSFITFRGSSINYCPVGRDLNFEGRKIFSNHPLNTEIRKRLAEDINRLYKMDSSFDLEMPLGGQISIDIYPKGFGKEIVLEKIPISYIPWFIGDNVGPDGNDKGIYEALGRKGFKTSGPTETIRIVSKILEQIEASR